MSNPSRVGTSRGIKSCITSRATSISASMRRLARTSSRIRDCSMVPAITVPSISRVSTARAS